MRREILTISVLAVSFGFHAAAARADEKCIDPERAVEQMRSQSASVDKVTNADLKRLKDAYAEVNGNRRIPPSDEALVFHRPDVPMIAWVIAFRDGCAIWQEPMTEETLRKALAANPNAPSESKPEDSKGSN